MRQDHAAAHHRRTRPRLRGQRRAAGARQARHGVPGAAAAALADGRAQRAARRAAGDEAALELLFRTLDLWPIATSIRASFRSDLRAASRWRAPSRSSPICFCSTSRSSRSMTRWRRACATNWPSWSTAGRSPRCWSRTTSRRRSGLPTGCSCFPPAPRVCWPRCRSRARARPHTPDELTAMRDEIARRINQAYCTRLSPPARRGGACRAADRSRLRRRAERTAPSRRRPPAPPSARTRRRARNGSARPRR